MGTFITCYGDAGYEHEGYAAQVLDDGSLTGCYSPETEARMVGQVVAACGCGWTGTTRYPTREPFDEDAEELALAEWEQAHARPVLEQAQHRDLDRLQRGLRDLAAGVEFTTAESRRELADRLQRTLRRLAEATALAERLHTQAAEQAELEGGAR